MNKIRFVDVLQVDDKLRDTIRRWRNRREIRKYMLTQHLISKEEHSRWLSGLRETVNQKVWIVFTDNVPIGSVYLQNLDYSRRYSEWGLYIAEPAYRGKGLGKCIVLRLLEVYFDEMGFETLSTKVLSDNVAALGLYRKLEFKPVDRLPYKGKKEIISLKFSKKDWLKLRDKLKDECYHRNRR